VFKTWVVLAALTAAFANDLTGQASVIGGDTLEIARSTLGRRCSRKHIALLGARSVSSTLRCVGWRWIGR
jgi:hypothetical protein